MSTKHLFVFIKIIIYSHPHFILNIVFIHKHIVILHADLPIIRTYSHLSRSLRNIIPNSGLNADLLYKTLAGMKIYKSSITKRIWSDHGHMNLLWSQIEKHWLMAFHQTAVKCSSCIWIWISYVVSWHHVHKSFWLHLVTISQSPVILGWIDTSITTVCGSLHFSKTAAKHQESAVIKMP